jgi:hypothetical protein
MHGLHTVRVRFLLLYIMLEIDFGEFWVFIFGMEDEMNFVLCLL